MRVIIFISFILYAGFGEAFPTPTAIEAKVQSLEFAISAFAIELRNLKESNTNLDQEVDHLKTQIAELLESKLELY